MRLMMDLGGGKFDILSVRRQVSWLHFDDLIVTARFHKNSRQKCCAKIVTHLRRNLTYASLVVLLPALRKFASNLIYAPLAAVLVFALKRRL